MLVSGHSDLEDLVYDIQMYSVLFYVSFLAFYRPMHVVQSAVLLS